MNLSEFPTGCFFSTHQMTVAFFATVIVFSYFHFGKNYGGKSGFPIFLYNNHFLNEIFLTFAPTNHQTTIID